MPDCSVSSPSREERHRGNFHKQRYSVRRCGHKLNACSDDEKVRANECGDHRFEHTYAVGCSGKEEHRRIYQRRRSNMSEIGLFGGGH